MRLSSMCEMAELRLRLRECEGRHKRLQEPKITMVHVQLDAPFPLPRIQRASTAVRNAVS